MIKTKKPRILFILPQYLPIPAVCGGATETLLTSLIKENEIKQRATFVFVSIFDKRAIESNYKHSNIYYFNQEGCCVNKRVYKKTKKMYFFYRIFRSIINKIISNRITIKIFKTPRSVMNLFFYQCYYIFKTERINYVIDESHNKRFKNGFGDFLRKIGKNRMFFHAHYVSKAPEYFDKYYRCLIGISNFVTKSWLSGTKYLPGKTLYNGININKFNLKTEKESLTALKRELGFLDNDFIVLYVGRIAPEKGVKELIQAFDLISDCEVKLLIIGNSYFLNSPNTDYVDVINKMVSKNPNIIHLNYIDNNNLPIYYAISNIQCVPSMWEEGAGLVVVEGMASPLPLIITNSGGMVEYTGPEPAIVLERDNRIQINIANSIIKLKNNKKLCQSMSISGLKRSKCFSEEIMYNNFIKIFDK